MLQAYGYFSSMEQVNALLYPQFNLHILCMYNYIALQNGIDPEAPPTAGGNKSSGGQVLRGPQAISYLMSELDKQKDKTVGG